ncbi:MAG: LysM peptidoglycan-binding domain-containing protein [Bacteroidales bacterium]|nr:LysM peptidoglycan-binding domain-containing protein [Bacteroidales bacterium]
MTKAERSKRKLFGGIGKFFMAAMAFSFFSNALISSPSSSDSIPIFPDLVYEYRITELNRLTPIELDYNEQVKRFIEVYTVEQREHLANIAGKANRYFPMIEQKLDKYGLPHELKYLAVVESGLDPFAVSNSGAVGLWQFKLNTSRMFDLTVNSYIDERRDPYKSTEAACKYLRYLYRIHDNWQLALAAYNGGPGVVRKALARSNEQQSFWELHSHFPPQTKSYVPAFIAVNYAMHYLEEHKITPKKMNHPYTNLDTIKLNYAVSFQHIADKTDISLTTLKELNPIYRRDFIPNMNRKAVLTLPEDKILSFLKNEESIYQASKANGSVSDKKIGSPAGKENKKKITHVVKKGEYFHKIAMRYNCTIENIREWNNLPDNSLQVGQELDIWVNPEYSEQIEEEKLGDREKTEADTAKRVVYYTVEEGDTIWSIADKFNCESVAKLIEVNNIQDEADIKPGERIKIYLDH